MKDFKSYSSEKSTPDPVDKSTADAESRENTESQLNSTVEMAKILSKAMSGKSESQILRTILAEAERGKREGTLTNADLDNFYSAVYPILDGAKRRKLKEVIARLKQI